MTEAENSTLCGAIWPTDPTREHCKCELPENHDEPMHRCGCGFQWGHQSIAEFLGFTAEDQQRFAADMRKIRDAEREAWRRSGEIYLAG